ncbi:MAG TPA: DUF2249 domain-containing protein [Microbacteriaceae bacterium]|nr:DUF2249 domain-containing protein [Microbacteriaceae bacterium]
MQNVEIHSSRESATAVTGGCACGGKNDATPEMDVQTIPHAVRHAAIFGALSSLQPGFSLIISATHKPVPLLKQLNEQQPHNFKTQYLDEGPDRWRVKITRN